MGYCIRGLEYWYQRVEILVSEGWGTGIRGLRYWLRYWYQRVGVLYQRVEVLAPGVEVLVSYGRV